MPTGCIDDDKNMHSLEQDDEQIFSYDEKRKYYTSLLNAEKIHRLNIKIYMKIQDLVHLK